MDWALNDVDAVMRESPHVHVFLVCVRGWNLLGRPRCRHVFLKTLGMLVSFLVKTRAKGWELKCVFNALILDHSFILSLLSYEIVNFYSGTPAWSCPIAWAFRRFGKRRIFTSCKRPLSKVQLYLTQTLFKANVILQTKGDNIKLKY